MVSAILLMAGKGERMKKDINKILLPLGNKKIYEYSLKVLLETVDEVVCVISEADSQLMKKLPKKVKVTFGGATRQESVLNGLRLVTNEYVLIHDAARPFITTELIEQIKMLLNPNTNVLVCNECKDTIKLLEGETIQTLDRKKLVRAATPQCSSTKYLLNGYNMALQDNNQFTDDLSVLEYYYPELVTELVYASDDIFKITTETDYQLAELIWRKYD